MTLTRFAIAGLAMVVLSAYCQSVRATCGDYLMPLHGGQLASDHGSTASANFLASGHSSNPEQWATGHFPTPSQHGYPRCKDGGCRQAPAAPPLESWIPTSSKENSTTVLIDQEQLDASRACFIFPADAAIYAGPILEVLSPPPRYS